MSKQHRSAATPQDRLLPKFTKFFFSRPRVTASLFVLLAAFGVLSYTTLLKRAGFPSVDVPYAVITGNYASNDPAEVDRSVTKPLLKLAQKQSDVEHVQSSSTPGFFTVTIQYKDGTDAQAATNNLQKSASSQHVIPASSRVKYNVPYFGPVGGLDKIDLAVSFYSKNNQASTGQLLAAGKQAADKLNAQHITGVESVFVKNPYETAAGPDGQELQLQRLFDRYGQRQDQQNKFYNSVLLGFSAVKGADAIELDTNVQNALNKLSTDPSLSAYDFKISASYAPSIKENIGELQSVLLEGLLAVLIIGSIIIAVRASIITVLSMLTVLTIVLGLLFVIGYTLNVITLFALILGLSLIVDDTIIMVEAIDAARRRESRPIDVVMQASRKVSRAMVAATSTAALSFAPLLFAGGVLGSFIRAIPVTIISSLIISLFVALIFIPFFSNFLLLGKKQLGEKGVTELAAGFEAWLARTIARPMLWARGSSKKLFSVGIVALVLGFVVIGAGLSIARLVVFNIFPPSKDTNALMLTLNYPAGTSIQDAQRIAGEADQLASQQLGSNYVKSTYYGMGQSQTAMEEIDITSYQDRAITAPQLVKQLQKTFDSQFKQAQVTFAQLDVGPPGSTFFVQLDASNRQAALKASNDLAAYLNGLELKRASGKMAHIINVMKPNPDEYSRVDNKQILAVSASFDGNDTTTLTTLAQDAVKKKFTATKLESYGLSSKALTFDIGQESENQDSFKTLALAFPVLLFVIYLLLALQFRSLLQPLLIFMAIPFSIFGIMFGLYITDNPISFFAMLGFFALIGLSIKNTILLTDFANQARRAGNGPIDSAVAALEERFRPLIATSITAVVSLIPLALTSPFWQGLAVVLIFGLISSTLLVITVFPYYYLGAEYLRARISRSGFFSWALLTIGFSLLLTNITGRTFISIVAGVIISSVISKFFQRRMRNSR